MSLLNFLIYLNASSDQNCQSTNNPSKNNFKWERSAKGLKVSNPSSNDFTIAPGETQTLFNGSRTLTQDNTTQYSLAPVSIPSSTYQLSWVGGTNPTFRTARTSGADATTQITVTLNGPVMTLASTGGTPLSLISGGVVVGDYVTIGNLFNSLNQGQWQIISLTATSLSVANPGGAAEGPITLGAGFASQLNIYSAAGVQVGDILEITGGFSPVSQGDYQITAVTDTYLQFSSTAVLPTEGPITTEAIAVYYAAKEFIYMEVSQECAVSINGGASINVKPLSETCCNGACKPGMLLLTSPVHSLSVTNNSIAQANVFLASVE